MHPTSGGAGRLERLATRFRWPMIAAWIVLRIGGLARKADPASDSVRQSLVASRAWRVGGMRAGAEITMQGQ